MHVSVCGHKCLVTHTITYTPTPCTVCIVWVCMSCMVHKIHVHENIREPQLPRLRTATYMYMYVIMQCIVSLWCNVCVCGGVEGMGVYV